MKDKKNIFFEKNLKKAFTLIEILVAIIMATIVMTSIVLLFTSAVNNLHNQEILVDRNKNLRIASEYIGRDVRSAGSGYDVIGVGKIQLTFDGDWFKHESSLNPGLLPIYGENNIKQGSDSISLNYFSMEYPYPIGGLAEEFSPGDGSTSIKISSVDDNFLLNPNTRAINSMGESSIIAIARGKHAVLLRAKPVTGFVKGSFTQDNENSAHPSKLNHIIDLETSSTKDSFYPNSILTHTSVGASLSFPSTISTVYNMRNFTWNTYFIEYDLFKLPTLMVNKHWDPYRLDASTLATNNHQKIKNKVIVKNNTDNKILNLNKNESVVLASNNTIVSDSSPFLIAQNDDINFSTADKDSLSTYSDKDGAIVADGIEDLQIRYYIGNNENSIDSSPVDSLSGKVFPDVHGNSKKIYAVEIGLVGVTSTSMANYYFKSVPVTLFDNTPTVNSQYDDGYLARSVLVDYISVRSNLK